jgi:hypothetical protein
LRSRGKWGVMERGNCVSVGQAVTRVIAGLAAPVFEQGGVDEEADREDGEEGHLSRLPAGVQVDPLGEVIDPRWIVAGELPLSAVPVAGERHVADCGTGAAHALTIPGKSPFISALSGLTCVSPLLPNLLARMSSLWRSQWQWRRNALPTLANRLLWKSGPVSFATDTGPEKSIAKPSRLSGRLPNWLIASNGRSDSTRKAMKPLSLTTSEVTLPDLREGRCLGEAHAD